MTIKSKIVAISNGLRIKKEGNNPFQKFDYFRPDDILKALTPLLAEFKLFMSFNLPYNHEKNMYEAVLYFEDLDDEKQNLTYKFDIPLTKVQGASEAQGAGATMTYAKRYSIMNAFSIADNLDDLDAKKPLVEARTGNTSPSYQKPQGGANTGLKCDFCGASLRLTRAGDAFTCPNWKRDGSGCKGTYVKMGPDNQDQQQKWGHEPKFENNTPEEYGG